MKRSLVVLLTLCVHLAWAQSTEYDASPEYPYGRLNPAAPSQVADFAEMIGSSECVSQQRQQDGTWLDTLRMIWNFSYIMNGTAVQDEVYLEDGRYAGSLRQYHPDSASWYVSFYSSQGLPPYNFWVGSREGNKIVLKRNSVIQGRPGVSRLTFYDLDPGHFKWIGEWISDDGQTPFVFWRISCTKREDSRRH